MKVALVTGATGFCGRALTEFIVQQGVTPVLFERRRFYDPARLQAGPCANTVAAGLAGLNPEVVFHLVGKSHSESACELYEANFLTTLALFDALRLLKLRPVVVLCGSAAEYGRITLSDLPLSETSVARPVDPYGASKLAQTNLALLAAQAGIPVIISRPFNIVGPGMPSKLALGGFLDQLKQAVPSKHCTLLVGNLDTSRDFVTIGDVIRVWWELSQLTAARGRIINICSGVPLSIGDLIAHIKTYAPIPIEVKTELSRVRAQDIPVHYGDNTLLRQLLGWVPTPPDAETIRNIMHFHLSIPCPPSR
jgi:GDP-4-dehydro-6-deoxy-D-mannose reductase